MVKIVASVRLSDSSYKRCTFQKKDNNLIYSDELEKVIRFIRRWSVEDRYNVNLNWSVGDTAKIHRKEVFLCSRVDFNKMNEVIADINRAILSYYS